MIKNLDKIAGLLKVDLAKLTEALKSDQEVEFELPDITTFTAEELSIRDTNTKADGKREGESLGRTVGKELAVKDLKSAFGVEFDGKDLSKLVDTVKGQLGKGDAGKDEQIRLLQAKLTDKDTEITNLNAAHAQARQDAELLGMLPKERLATFNDQEYLTLVKGAMQFEQLDGKTVVKRNGEILRDTMTANPMGVQDAITGYFSERKWTGEPATPPAGGRGGGNSGATNKPTRTSEAIAQYEAQGKNPMSAEFGTYVQELAKGNPEFVFD